MKRIVSYLAFFRVTSLAIAQDCYWPSGDKAPSAFKPCNNKAGTCCYRLDDAHTDLCYDNGLCYSAFWGNVYRGACTSQSWDRSSGCASQCLTYNSNTESPISPCNDRSLCCGGAENVTSCCENKSGFAWRNATLLTNISSQSKDSPTSSSSSSSNSNPSAASSPNQAASTNTQTQNSDTAVKVGLGTALGLSLATIIVLVCMLIGQRQRRAQPTMLSDPSAHGLKPPMPWVYGHEGSIITSAPSERPQSPVMLSDSGIHELDANRRTMLEAYKSPESARHTVHSIAASDAPSAPNAS